MRNLPYKDTEGFLLLAIILVIALAFGLSGCGTFQRAKQVKLTGSAKRKVLLKTCVHDFLNEDVNPMGSMAICHGIYKRWE